MALNPTKIRKDFPILKTKMNGKPLVYLDSAASAEKPKQVINAVKNFYEKEYANIHRGIYVLSDRASEKYENVRDQVAKFIGAEKREEIIFTSGTTMSINLAMYSWGYENLKDGDEIILSEMEHHANIVPWQVLAKGKNVKIHFIKVKKDFTLDLAHYKRLLNKNTKLVSVVHVSNVLGTVNPVKEITKLAHKYGATVLIDGAQSIPHMPINVKDIGCDFFAFSGHKMLGPAGTGILYGKEAILNSMRPFFYGGNMIEGVSLLSSAFKKAPDRFEAGTPNIEGIIGLGEAVKYLEKIGMKNIHEYEQELAKYALEKFTGIPDFTLYGPTDYKKRAAVFAFRLGEIHSHDIADILDKEGIAVRSGKQCAHPLIACLKEPAVSRASFYIYNTKSDVDKLISALRKVKNILCTSTDDHYRSLKSHVCGIINR